MQLVQMEKSYTKTWAGMVNRADIGKTLTRHCKLGQIMRKEGQAYCFNNITSHFPIVLGQKSLSSKKYAPN